MKIITWEYKQFATPATSTSDIVLNYLNQQGEVGWELVHIRERNVRINNVEQKKLFFIMKRPKGQIDVRELQNLPIQ
jgi:hypothetical protein